MKIGDPCPHCGAATESDPNFPDRWWCPECDGGIPRKLAERLKCRAAEPGKCRSCGVKIQDAQGRSLGFCSQDCALASATRPDPEVDHPDHYGGEDNLYEAIKVIEAWGLGFCLGNTVKYISRAGKKDPAKEIEDLKKAQWYLERRISNLETEPV